LPASKTFDSDLMPYDDKNSSSLSR